MLTGETSGVDGFGDELAEVRWVSVAEAGELMEGMSEGVVQFLRRMLEEHD